MRPILSLVVVSLCFVIARPASGRQIDSPEERLLRDGHVNLVIRLEPTAAVAKAVDAADVQRIEESVRLLQDRFLQATTGVRVRRRLAYSPVMSVRVETPDAIDRLRSNPLVAGIDIDGGGSGAGLSTPRRGGAYLPSPRRLDESVVRIGADRVHEQGVRGEGVTIAFLDSGVDAGHPRLSGSVVDEACFLPDPADGYSGSLCPGGESTESGPGSADDDDGHGTAVAGILASRGSRSGVGPPHEVGVAPEANLVAVKVLNSDSRFESLVDVVSALEWIHRNAPYVDVVNLSIITDQGFGSVCDTNGGANRAIHNIVRLMNLSGIVVVASSGNGGESGMVRSPACISNVVAVGALDAADRLTSYTDGGVLLDLVAPGTDIRTTSPGGITSSFGGTSAAAPHAAGCAALLHAAADGLESEAYGRALLEEAHETVLDDRSGISYPKLDCHASFEVIRETGEPPSPPEPVERPMLEIYPNPADERAFASVALPDAQTVTLELFDMLGRSAFRQDVELPADRFVDLPIDTSGLVPGVYVVVIRGPSIELSESIVIR